MSKQNKSRLTRKAERIHEKYGSPIIELAIENDGDPFLDIAYTKFMVARYRAHQTLVASLVFWALCIISIVASFFISSMLLVTWTLLLWSITLQLVSTQLEACADHFNHSILISLLNNQTERLADEISELKKKGKKNGRGTRKTQRKSA